MQIKGKMTENVQVLQRSNQMSLPVKGGFDLILCLVKTVAILQGQACVRKKKRKRILQNQALTSRLVWTFVNKCIEMY